MLNTQFPFCLQLHNIELYRLIAANGFFSMKRIIYSNWVISTVGTYGWTYILLKETVVLYLVQII